MKSKSSKCECFIDHGGDKQFCEKCRDKSKTTKLKGTIEIPDDCWDCYFVLDTGISYRCLFHKEEHCRSKPDWCKLSHIDVYSREEE